MKNLNIHFYQNLGKLFYAIAASDRIVRKEEFTILKKIVKSEWLDIDTIEDDYKTDAAYQIEVVFDWLNSQNDLKAETSFNEFIVYKNEQEHFFTDKIKDLILKTASAIANSFSGINKSELIMLATLNMELNKKAK